jgi:hypothetical protein
LLNNIRKSSLIKSAICTVGLSGEGGAKLYLYQGQLHPPTITPLIVEAPLRNKKILLFLVRASKKLHCFWQSIVTLFEPYNYCRDVNNIKNHWSN